MSIPDYKNIDYRGFIFVVHEQHGLLLLHCTRKPKKGPHYQLPGGHVDNFEFEDAVKKLGESSTKEKILLEACKMGAARELFEETGIDVRGQLERLEPASILPPSTGNKLDCMLKDKCYFQLIVNDKDFFSVTYDNNETLMAANDMSGPKNIMLKISEEHSGFIFEADPYESIKKLKQHSGGSGSMALQMSMKNYANVKPNPNAPSEDGEVRLDKTDPYIDLEIYPQESQRNSIWSCFC